MGSENTAEADPEAAAIGSENTGHPRRGRRPAQLTPAAAAVLADYEKDLGRADLTEQTRRTYLSRVRGYLAWLETAAVDGDPLNERDAAIWAARDYKSFLQGVRKLKPSSVNTPLAAVSDLAMRRGLGELRGSDVARIDLPIRRAPRALSRREDVRMQRAAAAAGERERAVVFVMRFAGARIGEAVALDLADLPTTRRRRRLRIRGKGRKERQIPAHAEMVEAVEAWLTVRATIPGAGDSPALFLNRTGGRLSARSADIIVGAVAEAAGVDATAHTLRHTFADDLLRGGAKLTEVAELLGHASLDSTRIYTLPTEDDLATAVGRQHVDR